MSSTVNWSSKKRFLHHSSDPSPEVNNVAKAVIKAQAALDFAEALLEDFHTAEIYTISIRDTYKLSERLIESESAVTTFSQFSIKQKLDITCAATFYNSDSLKAYLTLLKKSNLQKVITNQDESKEYSQICQFLSEAGNSLAILEHEKFNEFFLEFAEIFNISQNDTEVTGVRTLLALAVNVYGPQCILEMSKRWAVETLTFKYVDMLRLLDNWEEFKQFPISWGIQIINSEGLK